MLGLDPLYWMLMLPGMALALWAQARVKMAYAKWAKVPTHGGMTGAEVARSLLDSEGLQDVQIEETQGWLTDHYDPRDRTLRLSPEVFQGRTVASAGIASHEAGHALQHAHGYYPMFLRQVLVPVCGIGSQLGMIMIMVGMMLAYGAPKWMWLAQLGVVLFAGVVAFQVITLPVEINASNRAKAAVIQHGIILPGQEEEGVRAILNAAAWTYVAAMISSALQLIYFMIRTGMLGGSRRDD